MTASIPAGEKSTKDSRGGVETTPTEEHRRTNKPNEKTNTAVMICPVCGNGTNHVDPDRPAMYVAQSRTPDSNRAFITPEKPTMARNPPPEPAMAITGT